MNIKKLFRLGSAFVLMLSSLLTIATPMVSAAPAFTCTWTGSGGNNLFSNALNWSNCGGLAPAPAGEDNLIFIKTSPTPLSLVNDIVGATFSSIIIDGSGTGDLSISGQAFTFADSGGSITDNSTASGANDRIDVNINMAVNHLMSVSSANTRLTLGSTGSVITGAGNIAKAGAGSLFMSGNNINWTGSLTANAGSVRATTPNAFGVSPTDAIFNNGSDFVVQNCVDLTFNGNVTLSGDSSIITGDYPNPKLASAVGCAGTGGNANENYGYDDQDSSTVTLAGNINLGSNITFASLTGTTNITGNLLGSFAITMLPGYSGKLIINSSNNASNTPNGTYTSALFSKTISDSSANTVEIFRNNKITIDGTRGDTTVHPGGFLDGTGTVGQLNIETGGIIGPGHSPGCINSGNLTLNGTYQAQIGGTTACTGYDQLVVTGTVNVANATLSPTLFGGFVPVGGQSYTIINNDGSDAVTGTFAGIAEGGTITANGVTYNVTYRGGSGNDIVLTVASVNASQLPGNPNTGFQILTSNPLITLAVSVLAAAFLLYASRRYKSAK